MEPAIFDFVNGLNDEEVDILLYEMMEEEQRGGSLWNKFMTKFGDKMPEMHFISPLRMKKHRYTGPFTKLDQRLNVDEDGNYLPEPKPGNEPINRVDESSMYHDIAYSKSDELKDRHTADKEMIKKLRNIRRDKTAPMSERVDAFLVGLPMKAKYKLGLGEVGATSQIIKQTKHEKGGMNNLITGAGKVKASLHTILKKMTIPDLKKISKDLDIKLPTGLNKKQLITRLKKFIKLHAMELEDDKIIYVFVRIP